MATEKGLYWLVLGVVALIFVNGTQFGRQCLLSRLEDRSIELAQRLSGHTAAALSLTEMRLAAQPYRCPRTQAATARMQAQFACVEGALARQQAEFARIQAEKARLEALQQARFGEMSRHRDFVIEVPPLKPLPNDGTI
jgi:hypothetical protein